jgi:tetratricopeptide (TPR) repeat protein
MQPEEAIPLAIRLLKLLKEKNQMESLDGCRILSVLGSVYVNLARIPEALAAHEEQRDIAQRLSNVEEESEAWYSLGIVYGRSNMFDSFDAFKKAIALVERSTVDDFAKTKNLPYYYVALGVNCSNRISLAHYMKFRMLQKTGIESRAMNTPETATKEGIHEAMQGVRVCVCACMRVRVVNSLQPVSFSVMSRL